ncbi:hypothetical protein AtDm6_0558 [Acetobacter tropicalis]|uniref:Uncharacterized protein n=1 Tax=Acetobacter tropicalis TaxID=104102 RepID=A0A095B9B8_9PROT|nr:hypothetical protein AtDm6_0558 [Acetobacter tropicalis]
MLPDWAASIAVAGGFFKFFSGHSLSGERGLRFFSGRATGNRNWFWRGRVLGFAPRRVCFGK